MDELVSVVWVYGLEYHHAAPNPAYPNGRAHPAAPGTLEMCHVELAYPAEGRGHYDITCHECGSRMMVSTSGTADDPVSVELACWKRREPLS